MILYLLIEVEIAIGATVGIQFVQLIQQTHHQVMYPWKQQRALYLPMTCQQSP
jgi:hypothetical protein